MNEAAQVAGRLAQARADGEELVVATVVRVEGSAYRRPGARMVVDSAGGRVGGVSGGCLEDDVAKKAWWLTEAGRCALRRYDSRDGGFGLGCSGSVEVLFERIGPASLLPELLGQAQAGRNGAATAVVIAADTPALGARLALLADGGTAGTLGDAALDARLFADLKAVVQERCSRLRSYVTRHGATELFLEYLAPPQRLVVFGAGPDAQPLVRLARMVGWHVTVADERPHYARPERFPDAEKVLAVGPAAAPRAAGVDADCAVVVMTHNYAQDRALLGQLLRKPPRYLGQLGPRRRTEALLAELRAAGPTPLHVEALHYPVGLDLGGREPATIALAIVAEIQAVLAGRGGAMLAERDAPIHTPTARDAATVAATAALQR